MGELQSGPLAHNFHLAPPATSVDGLLAVPIDITSLEGHIVFDAETRSAQADATIHYRVGPDTGNPTFDLRQRIEEAWLDGEPIAPERLGHHRFGPDAFDDLRVIQPAQQASSSHALRVRYALGLPDAQPGGGHPPLIDWQPGPRLRLCLGLSDRHRARGLEGWLPCNLPFDQFALQLELRLRGTPLAHTLLTTGRTTPLGENHWLVEFPATTTATSPLLELRPGDALERQSRALALPSGKAVTIDAYAPLGSSIDLGAELGRLGRALARCESELGPYPHADRFIAVLDDTDGAAFAGGVLTSSSGLERNVRRLWIGRGVLAASAADSWWSDGLCAFLEAPHPVPFDFLDAPVLASPREPWRRGAARDATSAGAHVWRGLASLLGLEPLRRLIGALQTRYGGQPVSTAMLEAFLLTHGSQPQVVDVFHHFVHGLPDPTPPPELWLRDAREDAGGDHSSGTFWDSPDVWLRNEDDGGLAHQNPRAGDDNWLHARVRNKAGAGAARHFVLAFQCRDFAGTQFSYPVDFLPCSTAVAELELAPGESRVVKARWPAALVPPAGTPTSLLAALLTRADPPILGRQASEHNNLAQKSLTIVTLFPEQAISLPVVLGNWLPAGDHRFDLELVLPQSAPLEVSVEHHRRELFVAGDVPAQPTPEARWRMPFPESRKPVVAISLPPFSQTRIGLELMAPRGSRPTNPFKVHLVQRNPRTRGVVGGVAIEVAIQSPESQANVTQS
jgi:hypothetical protein